MNTESTGAPITVRGTQSRHFRTAAGGCPRPARPVLFPRRGACVTRRALLAALREAEMQRWLQEEEQVPAGMHQHIL